MAAVFVAMVVVAGAGFGVASSLAAYAHRNWREVRPAPAVVAEA
ncbi:hypothetical protein WCD74_28680 [Actinomycetospora sp. OC33-EN08]|uniref:Uncharacterized protein n=1 Tax=Actinomycetospora aurantiaca TaxID=3129233 RepID=A0ABU8MWX1_9PSEU